MTTTRRKINLTRVEATELLRSTLGGAKRDHLGRPTVYWVPAWSNRDGDRHDGKVVVAGEFGIAAVTHLFAAMTDSPAYDRDGRLVVRVTGGGTPIDGLVANMIGNATGIAVKGEYL